MIILDIMIIYATTLDENAISVTFHPDRCSLVKNSDALTCKPHIPPWTRHNTLL